MLLIRDLTIDHVIDDFYLVIRHLGFIEAWHCLSCTVHILASTAQLDALGRDWIDADASESEGESSA